MIIIILACFAMSMLLTLYSAVFGNRMQVVRLSRSAEVPELGLGKEIEYHLFLSHRERRWRVQPHCRKCPECVPSLMDWAPPGLIVWASGQDQAAVIKRRTQVLLPGIKVFLGEKALPSVSADGLNRQHSGHSHEI